MCNYADDIHAPRNGSLDKPASINPATSGVTAGSGPDMWSPVSLIMVGNGDPMSATGLAEHLAFDLTASLHDIGHKRIYLTTTGMMGGSTKQLFVIKTDDVSRLADAGIPDDAWSVFASLDGSDYLGGGKARRRFHPNTADFDDDAGGLWLVERNREWAAGRGEPYFLDVKANMSQGAAFVLLNDADSRK